MDDAARKIVGNTAEKVVSDVIADPGKALDYPYALPDVRLPRLGGRAAPTSAAAAAGLLAGVAAARAHMDMTTCVSVVNAAGDLVNMLVREIRRNAARGVRPLRARRTGLDTVDVEFESQRSGVKSSVKQEMADMARTGLTVREIAAHYSYPEPDVRRILKSVNVVAAEAQTPSPRPAPVVLPDLGVTGIPAALELDVANAIEARIPSREIAAGAGITLEQVEAVRQAWGNTASSADAAVEVVAYQFEHKADPQPGLKPPDPTAENEILFYRGAAPDAWRVEIAPMLEARLTKDVEALRRQIVRGGGATEYDKFLENVRLFVDGGFPESDSGVPLMPEGRFKTLIRRGIRISEFKGWQTRVFCGTMTSEYPGGVKVRRCGLVLCILKKQNKADNADLDKAIENMDVWRAWRADQDERISERMERSKKRRNTGAERSDAAPTPSEIVRSTELSIVIQLQEQVRKAMAERLVTRDQLAGALRLTSNMVDSVLDSPDAAVHDLAAMAAVLGISFQITSRQSGS